MLTRRVGHVVELSLVKRSKRKVVFQLKSSPNRTKIGQSIATAKCSSQPLAWWPSCHGGQQCRYFLRCSNSIHIFVSIYPITIDLSFPGNDCQWPSQCGDNHFGEEVWADICHDGTNRWTLRCWKSFNSHPSDLFWRTKDSLQDTVLPKLNQQNA